MPQNVKLGIADFERYKDISNSNVGGGMIICREGTTRKG